MKKKTCLYVAALCFGMLLLASSASLAAQSQGNVEFTARVAPTGGRPEPVRQLTFYLLSKSLDDIRAEALQLEPQPDLDKFVDGLKSSPELKAWMKKHHTVQLAGDDFTKSLSPEEIVDVPEFFEAYMSHNAGVGFPDPKFREKDKKDDPEKYKEDKEKYLAGIRKFIAAVPESVVGIDSDLTAINPYDQWARIVDAQQQRLKKRTIELAQQHYLVAQSDTDLDGHGSFSGIAPKAYWISMIGTEAISGDVRLLWNVPVMVRAGETARVELNNLNAMRPYTTAENSNH